MGRRTDPPEDSNRRFRNAPVEGDPGRTLGSIASRGRRHQDAESFRAGVAASYGPGDARQQFFGRAKRPRGDQWIRRAVRWPGMWRGFGRPVPAVAYRGFGKITP